MSDLGPLTTTFTAPSACASDRGFYEIHSDDIVYDFMGPMDIETCYPDNYSTTRGAYYSPGVCPSGYTAACSRLNSVDTVTQTIHTCCPDVLEYECIVNSIRRVHSKFVCEHWLEDDSGTWTVSPLTRISDGNTAQTTKTGENNVAAVNAYGIEVRFIGDTFTSASDSSSSGASSATAEPSESNTAASASETAAAAADGEGEDEEAEDDGGSGLGTGAVAGIAVGAALGGLLIGGLVIWFLFRKWMQKRNEQEQEQKQFNTEAASTVAGGHGSNGSPGHMSSTAGGWSQSGNSPGTSPPPPGTAGMYTQNSGHTSNTPTPFGSQHQGYYAPGDQYQAYQKQASYQEQPLPPVPGKPHEMGDTSYHHEMDATPAVEMPAGDVASHGHTQRS